MTKIALTQGAYTARSLIADAQRCLNLFPEVDPTDSVFPVTHYPTPGLTQLIGAPIPGPTRLEWMTTNGTYFRVVGSNVYVVNTSTWVHTQIGTIAAGTTPCSMDDNGLVAILVDGTASGYAIDLTNNNTFGTIVNPSFYGADAVRFMDTFFIFNHPGTDEWYLSLSEMEYADFTTATVISGSITDAGTGYTNGTYTNVPFSGGSGSGAVAASVTVSSGIVTAITLPVPFPGIDYANTDVLSISSTNLGGAGSGLAYTLSTAGAFNSLDIAATTSMAGNNITLTVAHKNVWIFKTNNAEVWYDAGNSDFAFSQVPSIQIEHGCAAKYSVCSYDGSVFWIGRDRAGTAIVFQGTPTYQAERISTHCVEDVLNDFDDVSDAVGYIYQQGGHVFYVLNFPTADATWVYDLANKLWHERAWIDNNGLEHRHLMQFSVNTGAEIVGGDWSAGALYLLDQDNFTDNDQPIKRVRGFPHIVDDNARISYSQFILALDVGMTPNIPVADEPEIFLRWSDTAGNSWGQPVGRGMGATGQYHRSIQWRRLGLGRDRVFEVSWSAPMDVALNGAFADFTRLAT